ncbi:metal-dependent hydrolase [Haloferax namakaokahaiae]|uniref:Metal-dependent hydrolase n=1 Tax=Haloferax namakaokahaiae TaxID=1748331 RepID=A0ABD5ZCR1_9EURY
MPLGLVLGVLTRKRDKIKSTSHYERDNTSWNERERIMDYGHTLYLVAAITTHAAVGYALVRVLTPAPPVVGLLGGIAPDIDLYFGRLWEFPLVHRGVVHTPIFLGLLLVVLLLVGVRRWVVAGFGLAFVSHLLIDSFTNAGILWLYPVRTTHFAADISIHSALGNGILCALSLGLVRWGGRNRLGEYARFDSESDLERRR